MSSTLAAFVMSAFAMGAPGSSAQASIPPEEFSGAAKIYSIPPGSIGVALNELADLSGAHVLFEARLTQGLRTRGLFGRHSLRDALNKLLAGTNLGYRLSNNGRTVSIMLAQNVTGTQTDAGAIALPEVEVEPGQRGTGCGPYGGAPCSGFGGAGLAQDPYNTSYVLPDASTGTKTDTPVMDTPVNVQSITQQVLTDQQDTNLEQALRNVSGVFAKGGAVNGTGTPGFRINVRGFDENTIYRDGFRMDTSQIGTDFQSYLQLADVASVEVLKGPGAILYGLSEPGGVVNLVTKEPLNVPYFAVQQQIGSLAFYRTSVDATGPLTQDGSVLYRMNMSYENNGAPFGSFIDLLHSDSIFFAPVVKWNIDPSTWVELETQYLETTNGHTFDSVPVFNGVFVPVPRSRSYSESNPERETTLFSALTWSHQFDQDWSIKQQIAYLNLDRGHSIMFPTKVVNTADGPAFQRTTENIQQPQTTYSTNVDIIGHIDTFGAQHTLLLGGDVYQTTGNHVEVDISGSSLIDLFNPFHPGIPIFGKPDSPSTTSFTQTTAGLYLQDQVKLPYNFFLMAGARYQYIRQTGASGATLDSLMRTGTPLVGQEVTPRYGLLWRPQDWLSLYGNYEEGFGPNSGLVFPGTLVPPSNAKSWEAGVKLEFFDGRLRATADYFDLTKTNVPTADPNPLHNNFVVVTGEARSKGVELDIQGEILPGWNVIAAYTNQDVRVTNGTSSGIPTGDRFPNEPQNLASLWTTYEFQDETLKGWKIGGGYTYHGSQPINSIGANGVRPIPFPLLPSWGTVDLMAAYSFKLADANMTAQVNVTNLFDRTYYTDALNQSFDVPGLGIGRRSYGAPFAVLGSLRAQFNALPGPALAAEVAPPPPRVFTWTGIYVGAQIGYAWGDNTGNLAFATPGGLAGSDALTGPAKGVIGGGHAGYNLQINQWVIGVEGTVDGTTLHQTVLQAFTDPTKATPGGYVTGTVRSGIQGSIRGRAGIAFDRLLIYGTGGVAFADFNSDIQISGTDRRGPFFASGIRSSTRTGWTAGGGVEYAINNYWSVGAEYRYSDFGHIQDVQFPAVAGLSLTDNRHLAQNQVQVGVSYKFGTYAPVPLVAKY